MERLPDKLDSNARIEVRVNGVAVGTRRIVDFVGEITAIDDGTNDKVTLTIVSTDDNGNPVVNYWELENGDDLHEAQPIDYFEIAPDKSFNISTTTGDNGSFIGDAVLMGIGAPTIRLDATDTILFDPTLDTLLANTGVVAGSYGTSVKVPRFTVDARGRISSVTELPVPIPSPDHVPRAIADHSVDAGNGTTVETDLYSDTLAAGLLAANGDKVEYRAGGTFVSSATATRELKLYFGGTAIFDTGTLTISAAASWDLEALFIRVSSSVVRYTIKLNAEFAALSAYTAVGELTGLTLANTQVLKVTGQAAGVGAATNDIVAKLGSAMFWPAV